MSTHESRPSTNGRAPMARNFRMSTPAPNPTNAEASSRPASIVNRYKTNLMYSARFAQELACHQADDWFLPSKDELDLVFNNLKALDTPIGDFDKGCYWTSSEYDNQNTWTEYFSDGQQFDRIKTLSANKAGPQRLLTASMCSS